VRLDQLLEGNDSVQQHVASEREKQALIAVSPMARRAIKQEILPQIEESVISVDSVEEMGNSTKRSIEAAFSYKNEVYTRLISYKGIDQSDPQFLDDLLVVMDEWMRNTKAALEADDDSKDDEKGAPEPQQVEVKVKVEGEPVQVKDTSSDEEVPLTVADVFDLGDVRL
jgi:hypothetical protein